MTAIIIAFFIGLFVGAFIGALAVALCNAAGYADRERERDYHELEY